MDAVPPDLASEIRPKTANRPRGKPFVAGQKSPGKTFQPGQSGNPGGRPKEAADFRERCRQISFELLENARLRALTGKVNAAQVALIEAIWDRGGFIAPKRVEVSGPDGGPVELAQRRLKDMTSGELRKRLAVLRAERDRLLGEGAGEPAGEPTEGAPAEGEPSEG